MFVFSSATAEQTELVRSDKQNKYADSIISVIDGVHIPTQVLIDIQHDYPGHAAIEADEINVGNDKGVRMRVSNYDKPDRYEGFYLIYDSDWERIAEFDIIPPKPKPKPEPQLEVQVEEQPEPQPEPESESTDTDESEDTQVQQQTAEEESDADEEPRRNDSGSDEEENTNSEEPVETESSMTD